MSNALSNASTLKRAYPIGTYTSDCSCPVLGASQERRAKCAPFHDPAAMSTEPLVSLELFRHDDGPDKLLHRLSDQVMQHYAARLSRQGPQRSVAQTFQSLQYESLATVDQLFVRFER